MSGPWTCPDCGKHWGAERRSCACGASPLMDEKQRFTPIGHDKVVLLDRKPHVRLAGTSRDPYGLDDGKDDAA